MIWRPPTSVRYWQGADPSTNPSGYIVKFEISSSLTLWSKLGDQKLALLIDIASQGQQHATFLKTVC